MKTTSTKAVAVNAASLKIAGLYLVLGALWILFSDRAVGLLTQDPAKLVQINIIKGWGFMVVTAVLLYWLVRGQTNQILKNEELYRLLAENTVDVIWILDLDTQHFNYVSPAVERLRGYTPDDVMHQAMSEALTSESAQYLAQVLPQRLADFQAGVLSSYTDEIDQPCKNGGIAYTETTTLFFTNPQNGHTEVYGVSRDISERKEAEKKLHANERILKLFVEYAPAAIAMFDRDMQYVATSKRFLHDYRISDQNIIGRSHYEIFPEIPERWKDIHKRCLAGAVEKADEDPFPREDGTLDWIRWEIHPWYLNASEIGGIILFSEVISERKQAQEELNRTLVELQRSNTELEQFAYVASHDLQEPLRAVAGMVQLLEQRYKGQLDARADEYINLTVEAAERMQRLITDLLDYSRVGRFGKPFEQVKLENCLKIALANLQVAIEESHAQIVYDRLPTVAVDAAQISQVLQNLIGNAIKFRGERTPQIQIAANQLDGQWQIRIQDNGIGIDPKYFERIFLVFQRLHTRREYPGTGIGLSLCKKIIERHGGTIWVESQPGQGSTFYFTLPEKHT